MIKAENIHKSYGDLEVLKGVDLQIKKGEIISIVGASGAGKSTLLQIIGTLDSMDEGTLEIKDTPIFLNPKKSLSPVSWIKRLVNHIVDSTLILIIYCTFLYFFIESDFDSNSFKVIAGVYIIFGFSITKQLYFIIQESFWGKTLGKFVTKTIVITSSGNKPTLGNIIVRSLVRSVPFEPFSFIFSKNPIGWHDRFSNTIVINYKLLNDDKGKGLTDRELSLFRNKNIGFVFQFHHLLPEFTALENVCIPAFIQKKSKAEAEKRAMELLTSLGVDNRADHKPSELSGGEQQRVAVCRALINNPTVILADEPSGNLDSASAKELHELFFTLRDELNQTFVIVTHNEELANMADRKLTMKDGKIIS